MDEMMKVISKYANGTYLRVEWDNGQLVLEGKLIQFMKAIMAWRRKMMGIKNSMPVHSALKTFLII